MAGFRKKDQAKAKVDIGRGQIDVAKSDSRMAIGKLSNQERLELSREGAKNKVEGTIELNRLKAAQSTDAKN